MFKIITICKKSTYHIRLHCSLEKKQNTQNDKLYKNVTDFYIMRRCIVFKTAMEVGKTYNIKYKVLLVLQIKRLVDQQNNFMLDISKLLVLIGPDDAIISCNWIGLHLSLLIC